MIKIPANRQMSAGEFANYFGEIYKRRLARGEDRYPCMYVQNVGKFGFKYFKRLLTLLEASNAGYVSTCKDGSAWDEHELEDLQIGVVFREREYTNRRGKVKVILVPSEFKKVGDVEG